MFDKILVAIDGSESSLQALDYAAHLASQNNAELKIISAAEPLPPLTTQATPGFPSYIDNYQQELYESFEKIQKEQVERILKEYPNLKITAEVQEGRAVTVIREASEDADLIVLGHRGQSGILTWMLGSVAKQIVDSCTVPVLVIKDRNYCPT